MSNKDFALIGASGYITPRHMLAIQKKAKRMDIYYPKTLSEQTCYQTSQRSKPVSKQLYQQVLSLPMHPCLRTAEQEIIVGCITQCVDNVAHHD